MEESFGYPRTARGRETDTGQFRRTVIDRFLPTQVQCFDDALVKLNSLAEEYSRTENYSGGQKSLEHEFNKIIDEFLENAGIINGNGARCQFYMYRCLRRRITAEADIIRRAYA